MSAVRLPINMESNERAAALVEAALILPFLVIVLAGMCNLVLVMQQIQILSDAVREGVQAAIVSGKPAEEMPQEAKAFAENYLVDHGAAFGRNVMKMNIDPSLWSISPDWILLPVKNAPQVAMLKLTAKYQGKQNCVLCYQNIAKHVVPSAYYLQSTSAPTGIAGGGHP